MNLMDLAAERLVAGGARRHRAGLAATGCRRFARRGTSAGPAVAVLAETLLVAAGRDRQLVGRQSGQPGRHRRDSAGPPRRLAGHQRHGVRVHARIPAPRPSHVFRSPTGDFMSLVCFRNGSLAREWIRLEHRLDWDGVARLLEQQPGNDGYVMLPWLETEITPHVPHAGVRRFGFDRLDAGTQRARTRRGPDDGDGESRRRCHRAIRSSASSPPAVPPPIAPSCR